MMTRNYENGAYGSLGPASSPSPEEFRLKNVEARILEAESARETPGGGSSAIPFPEAFTIYLGSGGWRVFSKPGLPLVIVSGESVDVVNADSAISVPADPLYVEIEDRSGVAYAELKSGTGGVIPEASGETVRIAAVPIATIKNGTPVQQYHKGVVVIGGKGGGSVDCDGVSTELKADGDDSDSEDEIQIKGWDTGTPLSATTLADDLAAAEESEETESDDLIVVRQASGALAYKMIGHLRTSQGSGVPVMFDPVFGGDGSLVSVNPGLIPVGRQFFWVAPTVEAPSGGGPASDEAFYCIKLILSGGSSGIACSSVTVVEAPLNQDIMNSSPFMTLLPLYYTRGGAITLDCRHALSLPVRE